MQTPMSQNRWGETAAIRYEKQYMREKGLENRKEERQEPSGSYLNFRAPDLADFYRAPFCGRQEIG